MPTHQGKSQTDITLGGEGSSFQASQSFTATSPQAQLQLASATVGTERTADLGLTLLDAAGSPIGTIWASLQAGLEAADPTLGVQLSSSDQGSSGASGNPAPPSSTAALTSRDWTTTIRDRAGAAVASASAYWEVLAGVSAGGSVRQTVLSQDDDGLSIQLDYLSGRTTLATVTLSLTTRASGADVDAPTTDDTFTA